MNDRATAVLERYEIEVLRSRKGRGTILCETKTGLKVLKEYNGSKARLALLNELLCGIRENGFPEVEMILPDKEGELLVKDEDGLTYCLKEYTPGRECNIREYRECAAAAEDMARLHKAMELPELAARQELPMYSVAEETAKYNRELRRVRKYLKEKKGKSAFEYFLYQQYGYFFEKAEEIADKIKKHENLFSPANGNGSDGICHGDLQHHNILFKEDRFFFVNFEKFAYDSPIRDLSLFFRKMMEKNSWSVELGEYILKCYEKEKPLTQDDRYQLYCRLAYPEKFRKIVNFYYNSSKAWIPEKNLEKLEKIIRQEERKNAFLESYFSI